MINMAKDVIMPQGLIDLRAELKRMQSVARRHNGGKGYSIVSFDKIADFERRISAMEQEIARLKQEYGSGSAFKGEFKSRYNRTEAQINASKSNINAWNDLRKKYGTEKAKRIATRRRNLKKTFQEETSGNVPSSGKAARDRYSAIMDTLNEADRQKFREDYDSLTVLEVGSKWLEEGDWDEDEYMDADEAEELLIAWEKWMAG